MVYSIPVCVKPRLVRTAKTIKSCQCMNTQMRPLDKALIHENIQISLLLLFIIFLVHLNSVRLATSLKKKTQVINSKIAGDHVNSDLLGINITGSTNFTKS